MFCWRQRLSSGCVTLQTSSSKPGDKRKEFSDELKGLYCRFDTHDFITELAQIWSELQGKVVDDAEDFDFEIDARIIEGIFLKLNTRKASVEDFWNCALPTFLLYSVSCSHGLWKKTLYSLLGKPL